MTTSNRPSSLYPPTVTQASSPSRTAVSIKPLAILEVVRRKGRSWGLLAQYEEGRLGLHR
jgi:hypothetical protein